MYFYAFIIYLLVHSSSHEHLVSFNPVNDASVRLHLKPYFYQCGIYLTQVLKWSTTSTYQAFGAQSAVLTVPPLSVFSSMAVAAVFDVPGEILYVAPCKRPSINYTTQILCF